MNRDDRSSMNDPTDEPSRDQSTRSASGLSTEGSRPRVDTLDEEILSDDDLETPRRYEQPLADDADPVMPSNDSTVNTKI